MRKVYLDKKEICLEGDAPQVGSQLHDRFSIPPARNSMSPLTDARVCSGAVIVSTLPNIAKHACLQQIVDLEEKLHVGSCNVSPQLQLEKTLQYPLEPVQIYHVSSDEAKYWNEVDVFHPSLKAPGFSLYGVNEESRAGFTNAFGIAVRNTSRIAHGLFGLYDGVFQVIDIPEQQMGTPDIEGFLEQYFSAIK